MQQSHDRATAPAFMYAATVAVVTGAPDPNVSANANSDRRGVHRTNNPRGSVSCQVASASADRQSDARSDRAAETSSASTSSYRQSGVILAWRTLASLFVNALWLDWRCRQLGYCVWHPGCESSGEGIVD